MDSPFNQAIRARKRDLRSQYIGVRGALSETDRRIKDAARCNALTEYLLGLSFERPVVAMYRALRSEADVWGCRAPLIQAGWRIAVPVTDTSSRQLKLVLCDEDTVWKTGVLGIAEPLVGPGGDAMIDPRDVSVFCVPGLAFTKAGLRLGYGGGYYDRLFARQGVTAARIGILYQCQMADTLPGEAHDVLMHALATEEGVQSCSEAPGAAKESGSSGQP